MAQGAIGGATSYEFQSIKDIQADIEKWGSYIEEVKLEYETVIEDLTQAGYWMRSVSYDFKCLVMETKMIFDSFLTDFNIILNAVKEDRVTEREVELLNQVGIRAIKYNHEYGIIWHGQDYRWLNYGEVNFQKVEDLYADGRDLFVTLQDAGNAAARLKDYIIKVSSTHNNIIIGDSNGVIQIQQNTNNSKQNIAQNQEFDYDKAAECILKIIKLINSEYAKEDLGDNFENIKAGIEEIQKSINKHDSKSTIQKIWLKTRPLLDGVAGSLLASAIIEGLKILM